MKKLPSFKTIFQTVFNCLTFKEVLFVSIFNLNFFWKEMVFENELFIITINSNLKFSNSFLFLLMVSAESKKPTKNWWCDIGWSKSNVFLNEHLAATQASNVSSDFSTHVYLMFIFIHILTQSPSQGILSQQPCSWAFCSLQY